MPEDPSPAAGGARAAERRVAFVGQDIYFRQCSLSAAVAGLEPAFIDFREEARPGPMLASLREFDPDVVIVFRPEIIPAGLFGSLRGVTIGYITEPLPRSRSSRHPDLKERLRALRVVDPGNFDRVISFDPLIAQTAGRVLEVWRALPLPVDDILFMDVHEREHPPRLLFLGRSTEHRELMLEPVKRRYPLMHIGHGLLGPALRRFLARADVQINLHNNPYPTFENRVCIALAAGHLVISEPLSPSHGLVAGRDYLEARSGEAVLELIDEIDSDRNAYFEVQRSGRQQAERFRASLLYPELIADVLADIEQRGSPRRASGASAP